MSEPPTSDPKKPELKDLLIAVKDIVNWHDLGLHLDLPESKLASIATHPDIEGHRRMMLSEWLQFDPDASWEKLATALSKIGKNTIAANVRREFVIVHEWPSSTHAVPGAGSQETYAQIETKIQHSMHIIITFQHSKLYHAAALYVCIDCL